MWAPQLYEKKIFNNDSDLVINDITSIEQQIALEIYLRLTLKSIGMAVAWCQSTSDEK